MEGSVKKSKENQELSISLTLQSFDELELIYMSVENLERSKRKDISKTDRKRLLAMQFDLRIMLETARM